MLHSTTFIAKSIVSGTLWKTEAQGRHSESALPDNLQVFSINLYLPHPLCPTFSLGHDSRPIDKIGLKRLEMDRHDSEHPSSVNKHKHTLNDVNRLVVWSNLTCNLVCLDYRSMSMIGETSGIVGRSFIVSCRSMSIFNLWLVVWLMKRYHGLRLFDTLFIWWSSQAVILHLNESPSIYPEMEIGRS